MHDVAIIGGGIAGMATAARLQAQGLSTVLLEAHGQPGGCAGFFRRKGFSFDVGATTLVDFQPGGVGGQFWESIGAPPLVGEQLPGYVAWLPDRRVNLYRDPHKWSVERTRTLGDTPSHRRFWRLLDHIATVFWQASRRGARLPLRSAADIFRAIRSVGLGNLPMARYLTWKIGDALRAEGLRENRPLVGLLSMIVEDTVHSAIDDAPLINAALGITIRGAGLTRSSGGMRGFWQRLTEHYRSLGGRLRLGCRVTRIAGGEGQFAVETERGVFPAAQVVSTLPIELTARLAPAKLARRLAYYVRRDNEARGGAVVVFLGVPDDEVAGQEFTHHQLLHDYDATLGNGNNMFVSVSAPGDAQSAPPGMRAVMISTHCELGEWQRLSQPEYRRRKDEIGNQLVALARRVYPRLGISARVYEIGTPRTYERFTLRPQGAVGGVRQTLHNANQRAVPHEVGVPGFWLAGDTTWPGLGTVACVLGSRIVADEVLRRTHYLARKVHKRVAAQREIHALAPAN